MTRPGTWERVHTDAGWHLRLKGANGEPVLTSEVYIDPRSCENALEVAIRAIGLTDVYTVSIGGLLADVDERASTEEP